MQPLKYKIPSKGAFHASALFFALNATLEAKKVFHLGEVGLHPAGDLI